MPTIEHSPAKTIQGVIRAAATANPELDPLFPPREASEYLGVQPATMQAWRTTRGGGPRYVKMGKLIRYRLSDLKLYIDTCAKGGDVDEGR